MKEGSHLKRTVTIGFFGLYLPNCKKTFRAIFDNGIDIRSLKQWKWFYKKQFRMITRNINWKCQFDNIEMLGWLFLQHHFCSCLSLFPSDFQNTCIGQFHIFVAVLFVLAKIKSLKNVTEGCHKVQYFLSYRYRSTTVMCAPFHNEKSLNPEGKKGEDRAKVVLQKKPPEHFNLIDVTFPIYVPCYHSELPHIKPPTQKYFRYFKLRKSIPFRTYRIARYLIKPCKSISKYFGIGRPLVGCIPNACVVVDYI